VTGSGTDLGKSYILFIRSNLDTLSKRITDDCWILIVTERWYHGQMGMLATWLTNRMDKALHPYQCTCLSHIVKKMYNEYELHGMTDEKIRTAHFSQVEQRMATEEATCQLQNAEHSENNGDYDEDGGGGGAAKMANALQDGGVDKEKKAAMAAAQASAQAGKMLGKGIGGALGKGFGSFF